MSANPQSPSLNPPDDRSSTFSQHQYMNLTTFRKQGQPVTTPVWFALQEQRLFVYTGQATGKLKRIRQNPTVEVAPSSATGQPRGATVPGIARILAGRDAERAEALIRQKYGWQMRLMSFLNQRRSNIGEPVFLEITLGDPKRT